ncbi:hypothetical protein [Methylobacterium brachythecii]|uniref:Uncharacterized protein n=1 Tax=Methylobacterium brachythecii TaxID=1176177 RepID=A0A7W6AGZ4_9HYPH|nr:hypothetical protein [Methylobacterium brachythecii]MBB3901359.1 hypothetical protein [Methylobacterium brachythecii]GLS42934.1 hypothetical protein GCM10007884_09190 [Methylobacterium brachythecii]
MALESTTFAGAIHEIGSTLGREPTPEQISRIELVLQSLATIADDGQVVADLGAGPVPIAAAITTEIERLPAKAPKSQSNAGYVKVQLGSSTGYRKAGDLVVMLSAALKASDDAALDRAIAGWPNPWHRNSINRTQQVVIEKRNPALAKQYKETVGK